MSLLDAARRLVELGPPKSCEYNSFDGEHVPIMACCGASTLGPHLPRCPWLSMPRIVAALEAADAFLMALPEWKDKPELRDHDDVTGFGYCPICYESDGHLDACEYQALVAALKEPT